MTESAHKEMIMAVDDQPANLKLLEEMLRPRGYRVRSFPRGRLALAAAVDHPPDLVLLDINMPEMSGYEVCERLRSDPRLARVPVIFLSAMGETEDKIKAFNAGGADYVTKPFQFEEVRARVEAHLERRRLQQELERRNDRLEELVFERTRELAEAHARLKILDRAKNDFLHLISHELRTPLNGVLGVGELLLEESNGSAEAAGLRDLFDQSRRRVLNFVDDALLLTQIDVEPAEFRRAPTPFARVWSRAAELARASAESRGVKLPPAPKDLGFVAADEDLLVKALQTLLETAIKFSKPGESVGLACDMSPVSTKVMLETQSGAIPAGSISKFFDLLTIPETASQADLGLGPPVAARIISAFGGEVNIENRSPNGIRLLASFQCANV